MILLVLKNARGRHFFSQVVCTANGGQGAEEYKIPRSGLWRRFDAAVSLLRGIILGFCVNCLAPCLIVVDGRLCSGLVLFVKEFFDFRIRLAGSLSVSLFIVGILGYLI